MDEPGSEGTGRFTHHFHRLAVVVTVRAGGHDYAVAVSWHSPVSFSPPLYGIAISPGRPAYEPLLREREFVVNFLHLDRVEMIASLGEGSEGGTDDFERFQLVRRKALKTRAPLLEEAYAAHECRLVQHVTLGDHDWVVGQVVATHIGREVFQPQGLLDVARIDPALYIDVGTYRSALKDTLRRIESRTYRKR